MMLPKTLFHVISFGSVQRLAIGLDDKKLWFDSQQAASGAQPASYSVSTGPAYSGVNRGLKRSLGRSAKFKNECPLLRVQCVILGRGRNLSGLADGMSQLKVVF